MQHQARGAGACTARTLREADIELTGQDGEILREFLSESREGLALFETDVVALEAQPGETARVAGIFRVIHTLKGTSGMLGFARLAALAHAGETLLARVRDGKRRITPAVAGALLELSDALGKMLEAVEAGRGDTSEACTELTARLAALAAGTEATAPEPAPPSAEAGPAIAPADDSIRVGVDLLDRLMGLADELVLVRNQIDAGASQRSAEEAAGGARRRGSDVETIRHLNVVTSELQAEVMRLRMQRLAVLWARLPRLVRDLAAACGKRVALDLEGEEIELDRTILEAIRDPLVHLLRNAIDHGIEDPADRRLAGKPADGHLTLRAAYEGGRVRIELADDGAGIDPDEVRRTAVARGLFTAEEAAHLAGADLIQVLFRPGFSTSRQVSSLSGRGVGLDVVKTNVERIGGAVDIISTPGAGTIFAITLPLTLAVIPAVMVRAGGGQYALPMAGVLELMKWDGERTLEWVGSAPFLRRRGELLPVASLDAILTGTGGAAAPDRGMTGGAMVVLQAGVRRFGLMIDAIQDGQDIIVKPRPRHLGAAGVYAGSTILGDGSVALILDVTEVARRARVGAVRADAAAGRAVAETGEERALLVFRGPDDGRMVIPLDLVGRVERVPRSSVERSGDLEVLQHRGSVVPLIRVEESVQERRKLVRHAEGSDGDADLVVVILEREGRRAGLVVSHVTDIVRERLVVDRPAGRAGVLGSAIVGREVAEVLDLEGALRSRDPQFFGAPPAVVPPAAVVAGSGAAQMAGVRA